MVRYVSTHIYRPRVKRRILENAFSFCSGSSQFGILVNVRLGDALDVGG